MKNTSPLRYAGGKSAITKLLISILVQNNIKNCIFVEPFAGGCGLCMGIVNEIYINDLDRGVWAFWYSVLYETDRLIDTMHSTHITIDEWYRQREIIKNPTKYNLFELGFATFFLNRTNRSGIISAGVMGGTEQNGKYKIDCRFNKQKLADKIAFIVTNKNKIHLYNLDAIDFIRELAPLNGEIFMFIDPPYFKKGKTLYREYYNYSDHVRLANALRDTRVPWILTYDDDEHIREIFKEFKMSKILLRYSLQKKRDATELMFTSKGII